MRIFNFDSMLSFALYPDGNKKRNRDIQGYRLNVDQHSKNGSHVVDDETLSEFLMGMKVICLGLVKNEFKKLKHAINFKKMEIAEKGDYLIEKEFCTPDSNRPFPLLMFYKKQSGDRNKKKLFEFLKPFFRSIIGLHTERNLKLKGLKVGKEDIIKINNDYQSNVTQIAESIFKKLESSRSDVEVIGLFVDPYFIKKENIGLVVVDTTPADTLPRKKNDIRQEQTFGDIAVQENLETCNSTINAINSNDEFLFLDRLFAESKDNGLGNVSNISDETDNNGQISAQLDLSETNSDTTTKTFAISEINYFSWNSETKGKIKNLLEDYQKHLHINYFFYNPSLTKNKQTVINDLLNKLDDSSSEVFFHHVQQNATINILNKHRSFLFFPILNYFFNHIKKTGGELLLENIVKLK